MLGFEPRSVQSLSPGNGGSFLGYLSLQRRGGGYELFLFLEGFPEAQRPLPLPALTWFSLFFGLPRAQMGDLWAE